MLLEFLKLWFKIFGFLAIFLLCVWLIVITFQWNSIAGFFVLIFIAATISSVVIVLDR